MNDTESSLLQVTSVTTSNTPPVSEESRTSLVSEESRTSLINEESNTPLINEESLHNNTSSELPISNNDIENITKVKEKIASRRKQLFLLHHLLSLVNVILLFIMLICLSVDCNFFSLCFAVILIISFVMDCLSLSIILALISCILHIGYFVLFPVLFYYISSFHRIHGMIMNLLQFLVSIQVFLLIGHLVNYLIVLFY